MEKGQAEEIVKEYLLSEECPKNFRKEIEREEKMLSGEKPTYRFLSLVLPVLSSFLAAVAAEVCVKVTAKATEQTAAKIAMKVRKRFVGEKAQTEDERSALERKLLSEDDTKKFGKYIYYSLTKKPEVSYSEVLEELDREIYEYVKGNLGFDVSDVEINVCDLKTFIDLVYEGRSIDFEKTEIYRMLDEGDIRVESFLSAFTDPSKGVVVLVDPEKAKEYPEFSEFFSAKHARLASILAHEKYGHGFFFDQTTLGKSLAGYGFFKRELVQELPKEDIGKAILMRKLEPLYHSSLIPSEGFAVWLQEKVLSELLRRKPKQAQTIDREISEIFSLIGQRSDPFSRDGSDYFGEFFSGAVNPYSLGFNLCRTADESFGPACVVRAFEIAADIEFTLDFKYVSREEIIYALKDSRLRFDKRFENICHMDPPTGFAYNSILAFEKLVMKELGYSIPKRRVTITD